jgi:tyrosine ammonia-lyase
LLDRLVDGGGRIYDVTTGYGPLACQQITPDQSDRLQRNLLNHLATGVGIHFDIATTRAIMVARLSALTQGYSAARPETLGLIAACLDRGVTPVVPSKGTVGASGDLTPLSHVALALTGRGEAIIEGTRLPADVALARAGLSPLVLGRKEGLALVNGTSAMTGVAALSAVDAARLLYLTVFAGLLFAEVSAGHRDAWHPRFGHARPHPGQRAAHAALYAMSADAARLIEEGPLPPGIETEALDEDCVAHRRAMPQLVSRLA